ncbi:MAG TPA: STAS domain-containing protein [Chitinispirillaceae bacterium]|nr:STAS domain-containing protein [Chitinispirillaceae bacterium]
MVLSQEMYTRIYRLYKRNINAQTIATTLNIPLRTVLSVINRFESAGNANQEEKADLQMNNEPATENSSTFLDVYTYAKTRYMIIEFVGVLTDNYADTITKELQKILSSNWKAVGLKMNDVRLIDKSIADIILAYHQKCSSVAKFFAILDPSPQIEPHLKQFNIENTIPVFGTERAFEDNAFSKKTSNFTKRI